MSTPDVLKEVAGILAQSERLVVSTGAGISNESGIPTFRDAHEGLWARYEPSQLATPQAFQADPKLVWDWYQYRRDLINQAKPNPAHYALVEMEALLPQVVIVTQNVDGFHDMVGSRDVVCLHGNIQENKCFNDCQGAPTLVDITALEWDAETGPPRCPHCNAAYVRPNVVWFNESLPSDALDRAQQLSYQADVMLVIGTSGVVYPAALLPQIAARYGATVIEINPNESGISFLARHRLAAPAGEVLPQIVELMRRQSSNE